MITVLIALSTVSSANATGYYHPADIAAQSDQYARATEVASSAFSKAQERTGAMSHALAQYSQNIGLYGAATPSTLSGREHALTVVFNREHAQLAVFTNAMMDDFDQTFLSALDRQVTAHTGELTICEATVAIGRALPGMPTRQKENPDCVGSNLNEVLATAMDADPILIADIDEIIALQWPTISINNAPDSAVGNGDGYLHLGTIMNQHFGQSLARIEHEDEAARLPIMAKIEQGATKAERQAMIAQAHAIDADTAAKQAALAAPIIAALNTANAKRQKKGSAAVAWCLTPAILGGCIGEDVTDTLMPTLLDIRKVEKAFSAVY